MNCPVKPNVGKVDRIVRVIAGLALLSLFFVLDGAMKYLGLIGVVPLLTAAISFCPAYALVGVNTCGKGACDTGEKKACCGGGCHGENKDKAQKEDSA